MGLSAICEQAPGKAAAGLAMLHWAAGTRMLLLKRLGVPLPSYQALLKHLLGEAYCQQPRLPITGYTRRGVAQL
jgi:hypothetical protein